MQIANTRLTRSQEAQVFGMIAHQLEQITRIHSADVRTLGIVTYGPASPPGWSSGNQITLNADALPDWRTVDGLAVWLGVAMHELGHCTWSPPIHEFPHDLQTLFNLVEDQRQEALVADDLPGVVGSFTQAVSQLILASLTASASKIWPLVAGRLYLPAGLLQAVRAGAVSEQGPEWVAAVYDTIAGYKALNDPGFTDKDQAVVLLEKLRDLLGDIGEPPTICEAHGTGDPAIGGIPAEPDPNEEPAEGESEEGASSDDGEEGEGEGAGDGEGESDPDGEEPPDRDNNPNPGGQKPGKGHIHGIDAPTVESLANRIQKEARKAREDIDQGVREQAKAVLARIRGEDPGVAPIDRGGALRQAPSMDARVAQKRLMRSLKPLLTAAEAGLDRLTSTGRIRPDRMENGYRPDHVFDKWKLDQSESVSAEIILAVDVSGSMHHNMEDLGEAIWVMRQVVAKTASRIRVLLWDTQVTELRSPLTGQVEVLASRGGTNAKPVIRAAQAAFDASSAKRKWLILMTDGAVGADDDLVKRIDSLIASRVTVTILEFGDYADARAMVSDKSVVQHIDRLSEMPAILGGMLRRVYRKNIT